MTMRTCRNLSLAYLALPILACGACSSKSSSPAAGNDAGADSPSDRDASPDSGTSPDATPDAGSDGSSETGETGSTSAFAYFIKQANGTTTASLASGTITVSASYGTSGNAFKYVAPNYYGTSSNGFIALPNTLTGDFTISAQVTVTTQNKANNACGIGLGMTTGFNPTDTYGYILMRNSSNVAAGYYVSGAGAISAGAPSVPFTNNTPLALSFSR